MDFCASIRRIIRLCESNCRTTALSGASCAAFLAIASASGNRRSSTSTLYSSTSIASRSSTSTRFERSLSIWDSIVEFFWSRAISARRLPVDSSTSRRVRSMRRFNWLRASAGMSWRATAAATASRMARASAGERWAIRFASSCLAATSAESFAITRSGGVAAVSGLRFAAVSVAGGCSAAGTFGRDNASAITLRAAAASSAAAGFDGAGKSSDRPTAEQQAIITATAKQRS